MTTVPTHASDRVMAIRDQLDVPVVDGDGHLLEFMPRVFDILREVAGADAEAGLRRHLTVPWASVDTVVPTRVFSALPPLTRDRLSAFLPGLLHSRMDEIGIDYALLYPSQAIMTFNLGDETLRRNAARAFNRYYAETFEGYRDRLEPVAVIPTYTPEEAVDELEHIVDLGLKAIMLCGTVPRATRPDGSPRPWIDSLGHESLYDYDPFWKRCVELEIVPTFHGSAIGWGTRVSSTNYVHNHLGAFAAAQEGVCRSLVMGGVPQRFPELRFGFLEGGATWAAQLHSDLVGHFEKRNDQVVWRLADEQLDCNEAVELFSTYASGELASYEALVRDDVLRALHARPTPADTDDFATSGIGSVVDIDRIFRDQLFFGCEADDPMNGLAFDARFVGQETRINAFFASDIGHWDVPDMRNVLPEAWELVEEGIMTKHSFRAFTFDNVVTMLTTVNHRFFEGTVVEDAVEALS